MRNHLTRITFNHLEVLQKALLLHSFLYKLNRQCAFSAFTRRRSTCLHNCQWHAGRDFVCVHAPSLRQYRKLWTCLSTPTVMTYRRCTENSRPSKLAGIVKAMNNSELLYIRDHQLTIDVGLQCWPAGSVIHFVWCSQRIYRHPRWNRQILEEHRQLNALHIVITSERDDLKGAGVNAISCGLPLKRSTWSA